MNNLIVLKRCLTHILVIKILLLALVALSVGCNSIPKEPERTLEEVHYTDSLLQYKAFRDSLIAAGVIERYATNFSMKTDDFSADTTYRHKVFPLSRNGKYIEMNFNKEGDKGVLFFGIFYDARDWLFIDEVAFNIDGTIYRVKFGYNDMKRDVVYGGIYEFCLNIVNGNDTGEEFCESFIKKLVYANSVKIRYSGKGYYDFTVSAKDMEALKQTYEYYVALSGKFLCYPKAFAFVGEKEASHFVEPDVIIFGKEPDPRTPKEKLNDLIKELDELEKKL